jgi:hypothetical protein
MDAIAGHNMGMMGMSQPYMNMDYSGNPYSGNAGKQDPSPLSELNRNTISLIASVSIMDLINLMNHTA